MIAVPHITQTFVPTIIFGCAGYAYGLIEGVDENISAGVAAIAALADSILFCALNYLVRERLDISAKALYTGTNAVVSTAAILAAHEFQLISVQWAGAWLFVTGLIFASRLTILYRPDYLKIEE